MATADELMYRVKREAKGRVLFSVLGQALANGEPARGVLPSGQVAGVIDELLTWLRRTGFGDIEVIDRSVTSIEEQRPTEWMTFESLENALDPADPALTVEGWPRPHRVVVTARPA